MKVLLITGDGSMWPKVPAGKFDVVTAQDPFWRGLFALRVARRLGAKLNVQVHTDLSVYGGVRRMLMQIVLRHADSIRVVSEKIKAQVERIGVTAPITVLPVYIDVEKFSSVIPLPHSAKNILWVGRLEEEKNPLEAIRIFKEVAKIIPNATLIMLGSGTMQEVVEQEARELPNVRVVGWQNPINYIDTADVVLCTSLHESFGASIIEALAAGVPVVAPDVGVAKDAGAIVVPREKLAEAVVAALQSGVRGQLKVQLPTRGEWLNRWIQSL